VKGILKDRIHWRVTGSNFIVFSDWVFSHIRMLGGSEWKVGQTFSSKNKLVNTVK
jgi:hypothetical protein